MKRIEIMEPMVSSGTYEAYLLPCSVRSFWFHSVLFGALKVENGWP